MKQNECCTCPSVIQYQWLHHLSDFHEIQLGIIQKLLNIGAFCENWFSNIFYLGGKSIYTHIFHISWSVWVKLDK